MWLCCVALLQQPGSSEGSPGLPQAFLRKGSKQGCVFILSVPGQRCSLFSLVQKGTVGFILEEDLGNINVERDRL